MELIASLFDWVVAGPVKLLGFARFYPIPFAATFVGTIIMSFFICENMEGPKKLGFMLLVTYFQLILLWLIASKIWGLSVP